MNNLQRLKLCVNNSVKHIRRSDLRPIVQSIELRTESGCLARFTAFINGHRLSGLRWNVAKYGRTFVSGLPRNVNSSIRRKVERDVCAEYHRLITREGLGQREVAR